MRVPMSSVSGMTSFQGDRLKILYKKCAFADLAADGEQYMTHSED